MSKKKKNITDLTKIPYASPAKVVELKEEYLAQELNRFREEYQSKHREEVMGIEMGGMYYYGNWRDDEIYIVDNFVKIPSKRKKDDDEFIVMVRVWDGDEKKWGPIPHNSEEYQYQIDLYHFAKNVNFPKLTKHPSELFEEAEQALATGDISKYELEISERRDTEGPDTQVMHLGSKEALEAVHADLEHRRNHAELIKRTMGILIEQKKRELERVVSKLHGAIAVFEKKIKKIFRVITTLELYLGVDEEIVQILEGPTAPETDPICIRQALMFMDEEFGDPYDDGQGIEWKDLSAFGDWLVRNDNYKKVLPESKCIAALKARRNPKERTGNPYWKAEMAKMDEYTFLVMRNGDNIYRLITDKIEFNPRLFPKRKELQQLFELWKIADATEERFKEKDREEKKKEAEKFRHKKDIKEEGPEEDYSDQYVDFGKNINYHNKSQKLEERFTDLDYRGGNDKIGDVKEYAEDHVFFYKMRFTLFQGIIERTQIFQPMPEPIKLFDKSSMEKGLVRLIYDDELTLPSGRMSFWEWMKDMNDKIDYGSRIVLSHNWGFISSFVKDNGDNAKDPYYARKERGNRLDDRYGDGRGFSSLPDDPNPGLYYVKKGTRWEWRPVMIDNPFWREDLFTTPDEEDYAPDFKPEKKPKDPSKYIGPNSKANYGKHVSNSVWMSYDDQKKWFGKIVKDGTGFPFNENKGTHIYNVFKNPKRIQKYEWKDDWKWRDGKRVAVGKEPHFVTEKVKVNFLCVRYNPGDKIERDGWSWKWDAEERKMNLSWKITEDDAFIINYDEIKVEDIDFYLESRVDRRHYMNMMPLLWEVRKHLIAERKSEVDFKKLVQGEVYKATKRMPTDEQIDQACEDWKKNLKWKRAISHDDQKALRMIVKKLSK